MQKLDRIHVISAGLAAVIVACAMVLGGATFLGAHPIWSVSTSLYGVLIGLVAYLVLSIFNFKLRLIALGSAASVLVFWGVTSLGKFIFVASFADNSLAGWGWYLGWIGFVAACGFSLALAIQVLMTWNQSRKA